MKYKHVIWDFDGTLFDTYPVMAVAFLEGLAELGFLEQLDEMMARMQISMGFAEQYYTDRYKLNADFFAKYAERQEEGENKRAKPFAGVPEICEAICKCGGSNYLFTHRGSSAGCLLAQHGLTPFFTELVTGENHFARKPSPEGILYLVEKYSILKKDALMIGDRDIDIFSAAAAGIHACYLGERVSCPEGARYQITQIDELVAVLAL